MSPCELFESPIRRKHDREKWKSLTLKKGRGLLVSIAADHKRETTDWFSP